MNLRTQRIAIVVILAGFAYLGGYLVFRTLNLHRRPGAPGAYDLVVPRPQAALYWIFWPAIHLDGAATGIGFSIAP